MLQAFSSSSSTARTISWAQQPEGGATPAAARAPNVAADQARAILNWLRRDGLVVLDGRGRLTLTPWFGLQLDDAVGTARLQALRSACPQISTFVARMLGAFLIERAHAERADVKAVQNGLESQVARVLQLLAQKQPLVSARVPTGAPHLLNLRSPHYDGCLFNPSEPIDRGGQGVFFVGITTHKHAVAIKQLLADPAGPGDGDVAAFAREASATRRSSRYDILQLYSTDRHQYMVMPLFNGDLRQHAQAFMRLHAPDCGPTGQGLFGARYLLRKIVDELKFLHDVRRLMHQDIKPSNIFLQRDRKLLVLGDLGMASAIGEDGQARPRGYTPKFAAPEQVERGRRIDARVDIFGAATALIELLTTQCPAVMAYRREHFPQQASPGLFPFADQVPQMHAAHRRVVFAALDGTQLPSHGQTSADHAHQAHFQSIHHSINHCDPLLGDLLRHMLQHDPKQRPKAAQVLRWMDRYMVLNSASRAHVDAAWAEGVPRFSEPILSALRLLHSSLDGLATTSHRVSAA